MKIYPWLLSLAFVVLCLTCWAITHLVFASMQSTGRLIMPLPYITDFVFRSHLWLWFCPAPWLIYSAILSRRREITPAALFLFTGTILCTAAIVVGLVALAAIIPFLPFNIGLAPK